jgi:hypothetical protein
MQFIMGSRPEDVSDEEIAERCNELGGEMRTILNQGKPAYMIHPTDSSLQWRYKKFEKEGKRVRISLFRFADTCPKCGTSSGNLKTPPHWPEEDDGERVQYMDNMGSQLDEYFAYMGTSGRRDCLITDTEEEIFEGSEEVLQHFAQEAEEFKEKFARREESFNGLMERLGM